MRVEVPAIALTRLAVRRPRTVLAVTFVVMALAGALAAWRLQFRTSNLDLISPELPEVKRFLDFANEFGTPNVLVVVLSGPTEQLREWAPKAGAAIRLLPGIRAVIDQVPLPEDLAELADEHERFLASRDRRHFYLFVQPADASSSVATLDPFVTGVRRAVAGLGLPATVSVGYTGTPVYALDDRDIIQRDTMILSVLSFVLVLGLFALGFRRLVRPLLAMLCLLVVIILTLGTISLWPGHLTLLSATFASIIFGLGIDCAIHLINRVEELLPEGHPEAVALPLAVGSVGNGIVTGALTTAAVFFVMLASGFRGFAELGYVAGMGVLISLVTILLVFPAILVLLPPRHLPPPPPGWLVAPLHLLRRDPVVAVVTLPVLAACFLGDPGFDTDYLALQPKDSVTAALERQMIETSDFSTQFAAFVAPDRKRAVALAERLRQEPTVGEVRTIAELETLLPFGHSLADFPAAFVGLFKSAAGRYAVYVYPKANVWQPAAQAEFVGAMRPYDAEVTGMPFLGRFMMEHTRAALATTAVLGGLLLVLLVALDFRHPLWTLLAVLPTALTVLSLHGFMKLLHLPYNPLNIMALPLVIGMAVDSGVHLLHRWVDERGDLAATIASTGRGIMLASLTTLVAFASLALTEHRGLRSFAVVLSLGVVLSLLLSLSLLPWLLSHCRRWLPAGAASHDPAPVTGLAPHPSSIEHRQS